MKRPAFQFYTGDWTANPNLRRCTFAEKGIWIDVLCLMHDQPEYGVLRWPLKEIAEAVKCRPSDLQTLLRKGVLKGDDKHLEEPFVYVPRSGRKDGEPVTLLGTQDGPIWYSSRMVKDEYVRTIRGEGSRFGVGNGEPPKTPPDNAPKPPFGDGSSSSSPPSLREKKGRAQSTVDPRAPNADPPDLPDDEPDTTGHRPTAEGLACRAMRSAGLQGANPSDPRVIALCAQGATTAEFAGIAAEAVRKGKADGFAWTLTVLERRRAEAGAIALQPLRPVAPEPRTFRQRDADDASARIAEMTGGLVNAKPVGRKFFDDIDTIEEVQDAAKRLGG